jgi:drug/metabolite transporter (DMT)-like permease
MRTIIARLTIPGLVWLFLAFLWGTTWLVVRVGLEDLPPFTFAGVRFLLAGILLTAIATVRRVRLPTAPSDWAMMIGTGLSAIGVTYAFQFWGMQYVASGLAAVLFSTIPLLTILIAHVVLPDEPITLRKIGGVVLGTVGVAFIFSDQLAGNSPMAIWAIVGFLIGAVAMAHAQVVVRARGHRVDPVLLAAVQTVVGGTVLLGIGTSTEGPLMDQVWSLRALLAVGYLAILGTAVGFVALYYLLRHMQVTQVNSMMLVHPLVAMVLGWMVLGEQLSWPVLLGAGAIVAGLAPLLRPSPRIERRAGNLTITGEFQIEGAGD